jgi:hypothetical protein
MAIIARTGYQQRYQTPLLALSAIASTESFLFHETCLWKG